MYFTLFTDKNQVSMFMYLQANDLYVNSYYVWDLVSMSLRYQGSITTKIKDSAKVLVCFYVFPNSSDA